MDWSQDYSKEKTNLILIMVAPSDAFLSTTQQEISNLKKKKGCKSKFRML